MVDSPQPNAFATGRDPAHAAIALHTGLLDVLQRDELAGVIAHELAHIKARDTLTMTITATLAGAVSALAHWGMFWGGRRRVGLLGSLLVAMLAPLAATLVQMAISRGREFAADREGARICGRPLGLAAALAKIESAAAVVPNEAAELHPAMAPLYIVNPLHGRLAALFATHPPVCGTNCCA